MSGGPGVFVLTAPSTLVAMRTAQFATEDDFQDLIARFPALLAGDQIDAAVPRRFLLVAREQGVADAEGVGARWSLDHLFLDQDGIPTLVEVKRATDTRLRREVVGQMLDYAANGVLYWPVAEIRARVEARCRAEGAEVTAVLEALTGGPIEPEAYWARVAEHLQVGRIRLLFVADRIPAELRRVVEFLNGQMQPAEVLALELRQYEGEGLRTLVPLIVGQTQEAAQKKGASTLPRRRQDEDEFLAAFEARHGAVMGQAAAQIVDWIHRRADRGFIGTGTAPSYGPLFVRGRRNLVPFALWPDGSLAIQFEYLRSDPAYASDESRHAILDDLVALGFPLAADAIGKRPSVKPAIWSAPGRVEAFLQLMDGLADRLRLTPPLSVSPEEPPLTMVLP